MTDSAPTTAPAAPAAPASAEGEAILCPMCDYDLRGLVEPRCPECGYTFDWQDLRDPARRLHKYVFEHHPERNVRSFLRTMIGGLRPRKFWTGLLPSQPSRPRRLLIYATVIAALTLLPIALFAATQVGRSWSDLSRLRRQWAATLATPRGKMIVQRQFPGATTAQVLDRLAPRPSLRRILRNTRLGALFLAVVVLQAGPVVWVAFTLASLTILQVSLHRARMRQIHLVRCVVYCADAFAWAQLLLIAATSVLLILTVSFPSQAGLLRFGGAWWNDERTILWTFACPTIAMLLVFQYRLIVAFRTYLRFPQPVFTILLTQFTVFLAVLAALVYFVPSDL